MTHPRYAYSQYTQWLWKLDCSLGSYLIRPFSWAIQPYQRWLYRTVYKKAIKKWPHLREEILSGADYSELLIDL